MLLPLPADAVLEVGALEWIPGRDGAADRLAVATRRGEIWMASGVEGELSGVAWRRFAGKPRFRGACYWQVVWTVSPTMIELQVTERGWGGGG